MRQQPVIWKLKSALMVKKDITSITERACELVWKVVRKSCAISGDQVVVPLVRFHRQQDVETGIGQKPVIFRQDFTRKVIRGEALKIIDPKMDPLRSAGRFLRSRQLMFLAKGTFGFRQRPRLEVTDGRQTNGRVG